MITLTEWMINSVNETQLQKLFLLLLKIRKFTCFFFIVVLAFFGARISFIRLNHSCLHLSYRKRKRSLQFFYTTLCFWILENSWNRKRMINQLLHRMVEIPAFQEITTNKCRVIFRNVLFNYMKVMIIKFLWIFYRFLIPHYP